MNLSELYDRLDIQPDEYLSWGTEGPGTGFMGGISTSQALAARVWPQDLNCWAGFGVMDPTKAVSRGSATDVTRIPAIWADLDVKQGGFPSIQAAIGVVSELSNMLNAQPAGIIFSGGGVQPIWALECDDVTQAAVLLARFGSLVRLVSDRMCSASVDNVFEPARILRVPGTNNVKQADPRPTGLHMPDDWTPLEAATLEDVLDTYGAVAVSDPYSEEERSDPDEWLFAKTTCGYATTMWNGWSTDEPNARHQWLGSQFIRLYASKRMGCITEEDFGKARQALVERFTYLCEKGINGEPRKVGYREVESWETAAIKRAAAKSDDSIWASDLGGSPHTHWIPLSVRAEGGLFPDPDTYIGAGGLQVKDLSEHIIEHIGPFAVGPEGKLWRYVDGVYRRGGDAAVGAAVSLVLANRFRASHLNNVILYLTATAPVKLTGAPVAPEYINCKNGLLNWKTGELEPHNPLLPSVTQIPIEYDPEAQAPHIRDFIVRSMGGQEMVDFFSEVAGAVLYGGRPFHQRAIMLEGGGQNGKSVAIAVLQALAGEANCSSVAPQALGVSRFATSRLFGMLANLVGDVDADTFAKTAVFKAVTSGDLIEGEEKYSNAFTFNPVATIVCSFNELPQTADRTEGFYRRWLVVPFPNKFVDVPSGPNEYSRDGMLVNRLTQPRELSGFLNMAVDGLRRLEKRGDFDEPLAVRVALQKFKTASNPFRQWFDAEVEVDSDPQSSKRVAGAVAYGAYRNWMANNGFKPVAVNKFAVEMKSEGIQTYRTMKERGYEGITLHAQGMATIHPIGSEDSE